MEEHRDIGEGHWDMGRTWMWGALGHERGKVLGKGSALGNERGTRMWGHWDMRRMCRQMKGALGHQDGPG